MTTRGPTNILSGEIMPVAPDIKDPELAAFIRSLLDYLRRLTGKLARFGGGSGVVPTFAASLNGDQSIVGSVLTIQWENVIHRDIGVYAFEAPSHEIMIREAGTYSVEIDVRLLKNVPHVITVAVNGVVPVYGTSLVKPGDADLSYSFMIPVVCAVNDVITVIVDDQGFGNCTVEASGTRLLISKIGVDG